MKEFEERIIEYIGSKPSINEAWQRLDVLDEAEEFPNDIINAAEYETEAHKAAFNNILDKALMNK